MMDLFFESFVTTTQRLLQLGCLWISPAATDEEKTQRISAIIQNLVSSLPAGAEMDNLDSINDYFHDAFDNLATAIRNQLKEPQRLATEGDGNELMRFVDFISYDSRAGVANPVRKLLDHRVEANAKQILMTWSSLFGWLDKRFEENASYNGARFRTAFGTLTAMLTFEYYRSENKLYTEPLRLCDALSTTEEVMRLAESEDRQSLAPVISSLLSVNMLAGHFQDDISLKTPLDLLTKTGIQSPYFDGTGQEKKLKFQFSYPDSVALQISRVPNFGFIQTSSTPLRAAYKNTFLDPSLEYAMLVSAYHYSHYIFVDIETIKAYLSSQCQASAGVGKLSFQQWLKGHTLSPLDASQIVPVFTGGYIIRSELGEMLAGAFSKADFSNVDFSYTAFEGVTLGTFKGATLCGCKLTRVNVPKETFNKHASLTFAEFNDCSSVEFLVNDSPIVERTQLRNSAYKGTTLPVGVELDAESRRQSPNLSGDVLRLLETNLAELRNIAQLNRAQVGQNQEQHQALVQQLNDIQTEMATLTASQEERAKLTRQQTAAWIQAVERLTGVIAGLQANNKQLISPGIFANVVGYLQSLEGVENPWISFGSYARYISGGDNGKDGIAGRDGQSGGSSGQGGSSGNDGTNGVDGRDGKPVSLVMQSLPDHDGRTKNFFVADERGEIEPRIMSLDAQAAIECITSGGHGGHGGRGGHGGNGASGINGQDATEHSTGTNGTNGGNGGRAGNGGLGGRGGHGGDVVIKLADDDAHLALAVRTIDTSGGRKGRGGDGGRGGKGGAGGRGGQSHSYSVQEMTGRDYEGNPIYSYVRKQSNGGAPGSRGVDENNGQSGHDGSPGDPGSIQFVLYNRATGLARRYKSVFDIKLTSVTFSGSPDGIIEPGETLTGFSFKIKNVGHMPVPPYGAICFGMRTDANLMTYSQLVQFPLREDAPMNEGAEFDVAGTLTFKVRPDIVGAARKDAQVFQVTPGFIGHFVHNRAQLNFRGFDGLRASKSLQVRYPVELSTAAATEAVAAGFQAPVVVKLKNISLRALGSKLANNARLLKVKMSAQTDGLFPTDGLWFSTNFGGQESLLSLATPVVFDIASLAGGAEQMIAGSLCLKKGYLPNNSGFKLKFQLELGDLNAPTRRAQTIQLAQRDFKVTKALADLDGEDSFDVMLVANVNTPLEAIHGWESHCQELGLKALTWNVSLQGDFTYFNEALNFPLALKNKIVVLFNDEYRDMLTNQPKKTRTALSSNEIAEAARLCNVRSFVVESNTLNQFDMETFLSPSLDERQATKHASKKAFFRAFKAGAQGTAGITAQEITGNKTLPHGFMPKLSMLDKKTQRLQNEAPRIMPEVSHWVSDAFRKRRTGNRFWVLKRYDIGKTYVMPGLSLVQPRIAIVHGAADAYDSAHGQFAFLKILPFATKLNMLGRLISGRASSMRCDLVKKAILSDLMEELGLFISKSRTAGIPTNVIYSDLENTRLKHLSALLRYNQPIVTGSTYFYEILLSYKYILKLAKDKSKLNFSLKGKLLDSIKKHGESLSAQFRNKRSRRSSRSDLRLDPKRDSFEPRLRSFINPIGVSNNRLILDSWYLSQPDRIYAHRIVSGAAARTSNGLSFVFNEADNAENRDKLVNAISGRARFLSPKVEHNTTQAPTPNAIADSEQPPSYEESVHGSITGTRRADVSDAELEKIQLRVSDMLSGGLGVFSAGAQQSPPEAPARVINFSN